MTDKELGYLCGLIDSEGCIYINYNKKRRYHTLRVQITISNKSITDWVKQLVGFGSSTHTNSTKRKNNPKYKKIFVYYTDGHNARKLLELVVNDLKEKQEQARIGIEFQLRRRATGVKGTSQKEFEIRESYRLLLSALKKSGAEEKSSDENCVNSVEFSYETIPSQAWLQEGVTTRDAVPIVGNGIVCSA